MSTACGCIYIFFALCVCMKVVTVGLSVTERLSSALNASDRRATEDMPCLLHIHTFKLSSTPMGSLLSWCVCAFEGLVKNKCVK